MSKQGTRQNVKVVCRIRPTNQKEINMGGVTCVKHTESNIEVAADGGTHNFNFDRVFGPDSNQPEVFEETARPLISDVLAGYNATIFAYGQTGTGKTHTMEGDITSETGKGIIPRVVEALFNGVEEADENIEFTFKVTYVEIYLERIRDLMDENRLKNNLAIREDKLKGIYIAGVTEVYVGSAEELLQIMHIGATNRATAATGMNEGSSRSHSVFTITVGQRDVNTNAMKNGKLVLVDLAGSEMVRKTNASGQQLEEAKTINKSLSALGQVIYALTDDKASHVPYRDSKLTRVLQDSLGGNSKTVLVVAVSPSSFNASETLSTIRFGQRAKSIENKVTINQTRSVEELEALLLRAEKAIDAQATHIVALTAQLQQYQQSGAIPIPPSQQQAQQQPASGNSSPTPNTSTKGAQQVQLEEGKVIIDAKKLQADIDMIKKLQQTVLSLTQELEDEKQDSMRKDSELTETVALLKEKDRLIQEAATMLDDVKKNNEGLRERSEQLLREKIEAIGELQSLKSSREDDVGKVRFEMMELEVRLQTLQTENKQLNDEIAELGGGNGTSSSTSGKPNNKNLISSNSTNDDEDAVTAQQAAAQIAASSRRLSAGGRQQSVTNNTVPEDTNSNKVLTSIESRELLEQFSEQFASICLKYNIDEQASAELFAVLDGYAMAQEQSVMALEEKHSANERTLTRRSRDLEEQRTRLEKDLQSRIESMIQLQMKFDSLSRLDSKHVGEIISEREQARQSSLQQRLEQLVAVHRQLLRKFATLELEANELKKKTQLRDERIRVLEGNARSLIGNIRSQAEKHVGELAILKEHIQILKGEFEHRAEEIKQEAATSPPSRGNIKVVVRPKALRGGGGHIQGGGGASKSFSFANNNSMDSDEQMTDLAQDIGATSVTESNNGGNGGNNNGGSMFSRFLGQKK